MPRRAAGRRPPATASATLPLRPDGQLRLALVADTHSRPDADGLRHLAALAPDAILHAGDIGALDVLDTLRAIAPVHAVRGNIDVRAPGLPDTLRLTLGDEASPALRILLTHIAVAGPRILPAAARQAQQAGASLIVCGHSHVPFFTSQGRLTLFNPGALGPRRFSLPVVFGLCEVTPGGVRLSHVDAHTGQRWLP